MGKSPDVGPARPDAGYSLHGSRRSIERAWRRVDPADAAGCPNNPLLYMEITMNELCTKGAVELAGLIASRKVRSAEVVDAYLARIEKVNPAVNAATATLGAC